MPSRQQRMAVKSEHRRDDVGNGICCDRTYSVGKYQRANRFWHCTDRQLLRDTLLTAADWIANGVDAGLFSYGIFLLTPAIAWWFCGQADAGHQRDNLLRDEMDEISYRPQAGRYDTATVLRVRRPLIEVSGPAWIRGGVPAKQGTLLAQTGLAAVR